MTFPFITYDLPEGYVPVTDYQQLYKLKNKKRRRIPSNIERRIGMILFTYSDLRDIYYKRILQHFTSEDLLKEMIKRKILYYKPYYG